MRPEDATLIGYALLIAGTIAVLWITDGSAAAAAGCIAVGAGGGFLGAGRALARPIPPPQEEP